MWALHFLQTQYDPALMAMTTNSMIRWQQCLHSVSNYPVMFLKQFSEK